MNTPYSCERLGYEDSGTGQDICTTCSAIFYGPLKSHNSARSIRVDCSPNTPSTSPLSGATTGCVRRSKRVIKAKGSSKGQAEQGASPNPRYLPGTLYIDGYRDIHLRSGFEGSVTDLVRLMGADLPYGSSERQASEEELTPPWRRYGAHHQSVATFKMSVLGKCRICTQIRRSVSNLSWSDLEKSKMFDTGCTTYGVYYFTETTSFWIVFYIGLSPGYPGLQFDPQTTALHLVCRPRIYFTSLFEPVNMRTRSSISSANFPIISQWIQHCNTAHECISSTSGASKFSPTRLIKIGGRLYPQLKLINTNETSFHGPYATLSYCWGVGVPVKLLSSSLSEFQKRIPESTLPKTLKEAVMVARQIGVKYLWIDALCIIQDSLDDWNREALKMADIYSNSYCNIAATHTRSCDDGLFVDRELNSLELTCVEAHWNEVDYRQLGLVDTEFWVKKLDKAPLNNRAWVLQERFLSPRTIHFGDDQVLWECYQGLRSENFPIGPIPGSAIDFEKRPFVVHHNQALERPYSNSLESYALWGHLVEKFCSGKLTKESDKLVAISGIARKLQSELNDEYVAGLWWNQLPAQLIWSGDGARPLQYRAPSWSWASIEGEISVPRLEVDLVSLIDQIEYNIEYVTGDKYGQVKSGGIRLKGTLYPHILMRYGKGWKMVFYDDALNSKNYAKPACLDVLEGQDYSENEYYCLPVLFERPTPVRHSVLSCLILQSTGRSQGEYSRIGMFPTNHKEDVDIMFHKSKPCEFFDDLYDSASTITLI